MKCKYCGAEVDANVKFCPNCGGNVSVVENATTPTNAPVNASVPTPVGMTTAGTIAPRKVYRPAGFGIAAWILMGLTIFLMGFMFTTLLMIGDNSSGENIVFLIFGGYLIFLLISAPGLFFLGFLMLLSLIFSIIQLAKTRRAFSWVTFVFCLIFIAIFVVFAMFMGGSDVVQTMFH